MEKLPPRIWLSIYASARIDSAAGSLDALLELSASQEAAGLGDAPWPPHYKKQRDEPPRKVDEPGQDVGEIGLRSSVARARARARDALMPIASVRPAPRRISSSSA